MRTGLQGFPYGRRPGRRSHLWCKSPHSFCYFVRYRYTDKQCDANVHFLLLLNKRMQPQNPFVYISNILSQVFFWVLSLPFHQVAQYIKFEMPVLQSFITKLKEEEDREVQKLRRRYVIYMIICFSILPQSKNIHTQTHESPQSYNGYQTHKHAFFLYLCL